ncbi:MAG: cobalt ECF transporter T component CbiQ [Methanoregula sp.]|jgi:cobalt/nickel transport system permease protein|uniref:cobalt ECF transporter T component CbiQ n=1 Tax=Methanoregula sp. TaxID=2052170 RepID=UPI003C16DB00
MFEDLLEDIAQKNGIRQVNTYLKLTAGTGAILLCLLSSSYFAPLFIVVLLTSGILFLARVDVKTYTILFLHFVALALVSVAGIVLIYGGDTVFWIWHPVSWFSLSITRESVNQGFFVFCRIIGGMSGVCFIALTTPMTDLFTVMRQCRIPEVVIDLAMIIYRTIFFLMDQVKQIYHAQVMRLGYSGWRESIHTFSMMCGAAFIASWDAGDDLIRAMDARCYDGKFALLGENRPVELRPLLALCIFLLAASAAVVTSQGMTLL